MGDSNKSPASESKPRPPLGEWRKDGFLANARRLFQDAPPEYTAANKKGLGWHIFTFMQVAVPLLAMWAFLEYHAPEAEKYWKKMAEEKNEKLKEMEEIQEHMKEDKEQKNSLREEIERLNGKIEKREERIDELESIISKMEGRFSELAQLLKEDKNKT
eukprot:Nk52_evm17s215 gene=Nk52_evmTU17s215